MKMLAMSRVKRLIINTLQEREYQPIELLEHLQYRFGEDILKEALAQLTSSRTVELTRTRHLRIRSS